MTDYDVIVVGCGPAGLMACAELAKRNMRVLGIDKKPILDMNFRSASGFCFLDQPFNFENIRMEQKKDSTKLHYTDTGFSIDYSDCRAVVERVVSRFRTGGRRLSCPANAGC